MVLLPKQWKSRSPPGIEARATPPAPKRTLHNLNHITRSLKTPVAGWSSPVARQAHNLKVTGSNPVPATILTCDRAPSGGPFAFERYGKNTCQIAAHVDLKFAILRRQDDLAHQRAQHVGCHHPPGFRILLERR